MKGSDLFWTASFLQKHVLITRCMLGVETMTERLENVFIKTFVGIH